MEEYRSLNEIIDTLLGPTGCPWDREQTLASMRSCLVEETAELIDAINLRDAHHIQEELGDLFFLVVFLCKLAEKEGYCQVKDVLQEISTKLIRRHPHIFEKKREHDRESLMKQWEEIKAKEKGKIQRKNLFDGVPKELSSLARGQKMLRHMKKGGLGSEEESFQDIFLNEERLGTFLWDTIKQADAVGLDAEQALRKKLSELEFSLKNSPLS